jgi:hypothetical protein
MGAPDIRAERTRAKVSCPRGAGLGEIDGDALYAPKKVIALAGGRTRGRGGDASGSEGNVEKYSCLWSGCDG